MTVEDKTQTGTFQGNAANETILVDIDVPNGETWYIESVEVSTQGDTTDTDDVDTHSVLHTASYLDAIGPSVDWSVPPNGGSLIIGSPNDAGASDGHDIHNIDAYAHDEMAFRVRMDSNGGDATIHWILRARRIL